MAEAEKAKGERRFLIPSTIGEEKATNPSNVPASRRSRARSRWTARARGGANSLCITPRAYRAGRAAVRAPRMRISPCKRDRCSSARSGGRLLLQLPRDARKPRCRVVHLAAKLRFLSFSTRPRPDTKRRTSANLPSCVSAANLLKRLHGAPADSIFSRFDSLGIPTARRTGSQLCGAVVAVLVGDSS